MIKLYVIKHGSHTLFVNSLFVCNYDRFDTFPTGDREKMNVNISTEFNFSDVYGAMNHGESLT